jgi:glycosyltransferase involved in cell wall biosynthesis
MIVTVVTPTFNAEAYLEQCIASVRRNRASGFEVEHVVVDGGSTDRTLEIATRHDVSIMAGRDAGIFDAINKGSFGTPGDLLGFLGADDLMLPGALQSVVNAYCASGRRWVVGGIRWIDADGVDFGGLAAPPHWMRPRMHVCLGWNPIMHMSTYLSRELFMELGGFDVSFRDSGDYDMFARALRIAPFARVNRPIACFRHTGNNNSLVNAERTRRENERIRDAYGPRSNFERAVWKAVLKIWFNGRNPEWLAAKLRRRMTASGPVRRPMRLVNMDAGKDAVR